MTELPPIERFNTSSGARIYRLPLELFPGFLGYAYLVLDAGPPTLVDTGSGLGHSNEHLLAGLTAIHDDLDEPLAPTDIRRILITHGHIDHFGGLSFALEQTGGAEVGIHELDRRVITAYEERVIVATKELRIFLERAGVSPRVQENLIEMYGFAKQHVRSERVDFGLEEEMLIEGMEFFHTPGHCPGQVCILIGDVLISADHILSRTTPHQAPESITHYTGLGHYLDSLRKIAHVDGLRLALGGHEDPVEDVYGRIEAIETSHARKLNRVLDIIGEAPEPVTISDISKAMYPDKHGYDVLMAIEEAGAHVEYLYQHASISVANLEQVEREDNPALTYRVS